MLLERIRTYVGTDDHDCNRCGGVTGVVYECRRCGTSVTEDETRCPSCSHVDIVRYEIR